MAFDPEKDVWELYYLPDDFSHSKNLAATNPAKLKELWWHETERNRALPDRNGALKGSPRRPQLAVEWKLGQVDREPCRRVKQVPLQR